MEKKASADVAAWFGNVSSSVLLIYSNKILMSSAIGYGFRFGVFRLSYESCELVFIRAQTSSEHVAFRSYDSLCSPLSHLQPGHDSFEGSWLCQENCYKQAR